MSVATQLGLTDPDRGLLGQARHRWAGWCGQHPGLRVVDDLLDLPGWLRAADKAHADDVLHVLAVLASPSGGGDDVAAGALAWVLLPGVCVVAHRLRGLSGRIDEVVAAQLWIEVRAFPWQRQRKVAANIVMNTRRGVLRELGVGAHLREVDPTWARTVPVEPAADVWRVVETRATPSGPSAGAELAAVMAWAVAEGVIDEGDRDLLVALAVAADEAGVTRSGCGQGGLCSRRVAAAVAARVGVSASTVRRRATRSLRAVASAYGQIPA
ncbi:MAG: hypothetical protein IPL43_11665 [Micropruina sp.]|nr:hypothetical protein [Micropruina sp.]